MPCRLCLGESELRDSHIIPEWCYKHVYDDKHRFVQLSNPAEAVDPKLYQKGLTERLLCADCETKRSRWEKYASRLFYAEPSDDVGLSFLRHGDHVVVEGVDYESFKLFQMSVLWMSSISNLKAFSGVHLGPHEERIRRMLLSGDPGEPQQYGCIVSLLLESDRRPLDQIMMAPEPFRFNEHRWYRFIFSFAVWAYVVSSHKKNFRETIGFVNRGGKMVMPWVLAGETPLMRKLASDVILPNKARLQRLK